MKEIKSTKIQTWMKPSTLKKLEAIRAKLEQELPMSVSRSHAIALIIEKIHENMGLDANQNPINHNPIAG